MSPLDGDELRARHHLRRTGARPFGHPHAPERRTTMTTPAPDEEPPWWSIDQAPCDEDQPRPIPVAPGIHVTITPTPPAAPEPAVTRDQERRTRARRWLLTHGAAAGVGWAFGLYDAIRAGLLVAHRGGVPAGLALAGFAYIGADLATERVITRYVPTIQLRRAAAWAARIPFATALLATALYAPTALN